MQIDKSKVLEMLNDKLDAKNLVISQVKRDKTLTSGEKLEWLESEQGERQLLKSIIKEIEVM